MILACVNLFDRHISLTKILMIMHSLAIRIRNRFCKLMNNIIKGLKKYFLFVSDLYVYYHYHTTTAISLWVGGANLN